MSTADITSIIQTVFVIISLGIAVKQIRDGTNAIKGQTYQSIISAYAEIEARISQDPETAKMYNDGCKNQNNLTPENKIRFEQIICSIFNFHENLYYQYDSGLLDEHLYAGWCKLLRKTLSQKGVKQYWKKRNKEGVYSSKFHVLVNMLRGDIERSKKIRKLLNINEN